MRSINKVILVWNLTKDPERKDSQWWHLFTTFTVATNREWYTTEWEKKTTAEFHRIAAWWKLSDLCANFLKKWKLVYIEWYLKTRVVEKEDWEKIYKTEVVLQDMIMLDKKGDYEWKKFSETDKNFEKIEKKIEKEDIKSSWWVDLDWEEF
jgi:single-strand DNA-binding protein